MLTPEQIRNRILSYLAAQPPDLNMARELLTPPIEDERATFCIGNVPHSLAYLYPSLFISAPLSGREQPVIIDYDEKQGFKTRRPEDNELSQIRYLFPSESVNISQRPLPDQLKGLPILGEGGFATVYDTCIDGYHTALKFLRYQNPDGTPYRLDDLRREARVTQELRANVPALADFLPAFIPTREIDHYLEMGQLPLLYRPGTELQTFLREKNPSPSERVLLITTITQQYQILHNVGLGHGDIKDSNLLVHAIPNSPLAIHALDFATGGVLTPELAKVDFVRLRELAHQILFQPLGLLNPPMSVRDALLEGHSRPLYLDLLRSDSLASLFKYLLAPNLLERYELFIEIV